MFFTNPLSVAIAKALMGDNNGPNPGRRSGGWVVPKKRGGHMQHKRAAMKRRAKIAHKKRGRR